MRCDVARPTSRASVSEKKAEGAAGRGWGVSSEEGYGSSTDACSTEQFNEDDAKESSSRSLNAWPQPLTRARVSSPDGEARAGARGCGLKRRSIKAVRKAERLPKDRICTSTPSESLEFKLQNCLRENSRVPLMSEETTAAAWRADAAKGSIKLQANCTVFASA